MGGKDKKGLEGGKKRRGEGGWEVGCLMGGGVEGGEGEEGASVGVETLPQSTDLRDSLWLSWQELGSDWLRSLLLGSWWVTGVTDCTALQSQGGESTALTPYSPPFSLHPRLLYCTLSGNRSLFSILSLSLQDPTTTPTQPPSTIKIGKYSI